MAHRSGQASRQLWHLAGVRGFVAGRRAGLTLGSCLGWLFLLVGLPLATAGARASEAAFPPRKPPPSARPRILGDLLDQPVDSANRRVPDVPGVKVDDGRAAAAGIRKLSPGKHLTLYTDLPSSAEIDNLPQVFDLALPQWCAYFRLDPAAHAAWRMTGFLMKDKQRFRSSGLLPADLPDFPHGYARNYDLWLYEQPSAYYRRHLLIHEGTHGFMNTVLGSCGPPWYMEGMAEMLSTHLWKDGKLLLSYMPVNREEVPEWGRIRIIKDALAAREALPLRKIVDFAAHEYMENKAYAWSWAAATFFDHHPRYQDRFRQLPQQVLSPNFNQRFYKALGDDWDLAAEEWQLLVTGLEYGYDVARTALDFTPGKPLPTGGSTVRVAADRGWQNSGLRLDAQAKYRLTAAGRYQVANEPTVWWCEPGGVSIRYYRGRPLGILLAAVRPDEPLKKGGSALLRPTVVGLGTTLEPAQSGTLFLRINDSAAELADNRGELQVEVRSDGKK